MSEQEDIAKAQERIARGEVGEGVAMMEALINRTDDAATIRSAKRVIREAEHPPSVWTGVMSLFLGAVPLLLLVIGIGGLLFLAFSIAGLVAGIRAKNKLKRGIELVGGKGVAYGGLVVSATHILLSLSLYTYLLLLMR